MQKLQPAKLLRLHITERDQHHGKPLYEAIVQKCLDLRIAGATVFRGLEGFGDAAEIHRSRLVGHDLPIVVQIVDTDENIQRLLPALEDMMDKGLIAISDVHTLRIRKTEGAAGI
ncbi:MAG TPA: DUF190 domain-containing protein [Bryobacteraceae bacterium]|nr:DUF190 domain-containing protein [Bryobacteraceae bacterium]